MKNNLAKGKRRSSEQQKIAWLLGHREAWEGYPRWNGRYRDAEPIFHAMQSEGLYSPKRHAGDDGLERLITKARRTRSRAKPQ